jgi:mediator of RNA polymerase II transcription subunit 29
MKFKLMVPHLKESLQKIMANAAALFYQNSQFDSCQKTTSAAVQRFDKSLEEFYAICDQIELNLALSLEVMNINADCQRNTPMCAGGSLAAMRFGAGASGGTSGTGGNAAAPSPVPGVNQVGDLQMYNQYQAIVKTQLACAKDVHDSLMECARKLGINRSGQSAS